MENPRSSQERWNDYFQKRTPKSSTVRKMISELHQAKKRYPGDSFLSAKNRVNCRCSIVGAGLTEDRKQVIDQRFIRTQSALENRFVVQLRIAFREQRDRILSRLPL